MIWIDKRKSLLIKGASILSAIYFVEINVMCDWVSYLYWYYNFLVFFLHGYNGQHRVVDWFFDWVVFYSPPPPSDSKTQVLLSSPIRSPLLTGTGGKNDRIGHLDVVEPGHLYLDIIIGHFVDWLKKKMKFPPLKDITCVLRYLWNLNMTHIGLFSWHLVGHEIIRPIRYNVTVVPYCIGREEGCFNYRMSVHLCILNYKHIHRNVGLPCWWKCVRVAWFCSTHVTQHVHYRQLRTQINTKSIIAQMPPSTWSINGPGAEWMDHKLHSQQLCMLVCKREVVTERVVHDIDDRAWWCNKRQWRFNDSKIEVTFQLYNNNNIL